LTRRARFLGASSNVSSSASSSGQIAIAIRVVENNETHPSPRMRSRSDAAVAQQPRCARVPIPHARATQM